ncbi:FCS-Like Zinc finger 15 isoform X1 [Lycium barbarum]|uniref:FCS-Like Zinc finger 15 isoform X1 n=1 Tax=Lycium barbarum TaxID=112863 RepID=UPI00293F54FB|nr:FCS-Like Zinc finger 15 isoform X1 [Lycium barbarum]
MVGLSVVLEGYSNNRDNISTQKSTNITASSTTGSSWQIVNKASMVKPTSPTTPSCPFSRRKYPVAVGFLDSCFLCKKKLLPGKDIYMYKSRVILCTLQMYRPALGGFVVPHRWELMGEWGFCSVECRCRQIFMDEEESVPKTKKRENNKSCTSSSSSSSSRSRKTASRNRPSGFAY